MSRANHNRPSAVFADLILHCTWKINVPSQTSLNDETLVMLVVIRILLEIMECQFGRVHDAVEVDIEDLQIRLLWILFRIGHSEHLVHTANPSICYDNINTFAWGVDYCCFEEFYLVVPGPNIAFDELSASMKL